MTEEIKKDYHFYAVSAYTWSTNEDLLKCIVGQQKVDKMYEAKTCRIYKIPLPSTANYHIENFLPEVDNIVLIDTITY